MSDTSQAAFAADQAAAVAAAGTNHGGFVGAEAPRALQEQEAARAAAAQQAAGQHPQTVAVDIDAIRNSLREEVKSQTYTQMEEMKASLARLEQEREAERQAAQAEIDAAAEAARLAEEEKMSAKSLVERRTQEISGELNTLKEQLAQRDALLEMERKYAELEGWKTQRFQQEDVRQNVHPALLPLVRGSTPEEIEASLQEFANATTVFLTEAQQMQQQAFVQAPGVSTRAPGALSSPVEMAEQTRSMKERDVRDMSMAEYIKQRDVLLRQRPPGF